MRSPTLNSLMFLRRAPVAVALLIGSLVHMQAAGAASPPYPPKTVRFIVGFGPGGITDSLARVVADQFFKFSGSTVIVENKPAGGGRVAAEYVSEHTPDGSALLVAGKGVISVAAAIYPDLSYDPLRDLVPVTTIAEIPTFFLLVPSGHPAKTFAEFVAWAKAHPDKSNYATPAPSYTLPIEALKLKTKMPATAIPYRSGNEAVLSVAAGQTSLVVADPLLALPHLNSGRVKALAVSGDARLPDWPDVPTLGELGLATNTTASAIGIFAPAGTPSEIVSAIQQEVSRIVHTPEVEGKLNTWVLAPGGILSSQYRARLSADVKELRQVVKDAALKFEQ